MTRIVHDISDLGIGLSGSICCCGHCTVGPVILRDHLADIFRDDQILGFRNRFHAVTDDSSDNGSSKADCDSCHQTHFAFAGGSWLLLVIVRKSLFLTAVIRAFILFDRIHLDLHLSVLTTTNYCCSNKKVFRPCFA